MKQLITLSDIKGRRPYGMLDSQGFRLANFMASTNDEDFLTDPSGSRRFLCFKVQDIDLTFKGVHIDDVWAEAYYWFRHPPKDWHYFITPADMEELDRNNSEFAYRSQEFEYVTQFFSTPTEKNPATHVAPASVIRDFLRVVTGNNNLNHNHIGKAMAQLGFEQSSARVNGFTHPTKVWRIVVHDDIQNSIFDKYTVD